MRQPADAGIIDERCSYTRNSFLVAAGLSRSAFSAAVRSGLRVRRVGKRTFILGADWLAFLREAPSPRAATGNTVSQS